MKRNDFPTEVLDVTIQDLDHKGFGFARYVHAPDRGSNGKGLKLFIPNTIPGDKVRVTVENAKGRRSAQIPHYDELLEPSPDRNQAIPYKQANSGGTPLVFMNYEAQLEVKENLVKKALADKEIDPSLVQPIMGMKDPFRYRNKMELTFGKAGELGMHEIGNYKKVIDLDDSAIAPEIMVAIKKVVSQWQEDYQLSGYDKDLVMGDLKNLMMRRSFTTHEVMVVLVANGLLEDYQSASQELVTRLSQQFPEIKSIIWLEKETVRGEHPVERPRLLYGRDYIQDELKGYRYKIRYNTFFQASSLQAEKMIDCALSYAQVNQNMRVVDLFCGIGTFSLPFAAKAKELAGIELVENSILSARENATRAELHNTRFIVADAKEGLEQLKEEWPTTDLLIINPPRGGGGRKLMRRIGRYGAEKIVYISCNPRTLADDLAWLAEFDYEPQIIQPIDQFPHTLHVECVVLMSRTGE
ncbi:23S rRNA (uracil(1939)-C(5))-methyltransferase RlmD [Facklamia sp. DSM 111018]|uniref:23S rRNA (Uracil(1939)-C(5))-methyltransferase RlmD n=1 Tax=Facklamia lactis TaxID=2749967 RepID=A0ABS0LSF0_9LACT|nr:23S rRNA (uracil(1939)-C(5))-methyltransferase RlmD [Facklamia lactis]MBG9986266.1 23S rRNA (uracil(1939)-C(5))-methyltransferase RlmD [Facklamia lactis]